MKKKSILVSLICIVFLMSSCVNNDTSSGTKLETDANSKAAPNTSSTETVIAVPEDGTYQNEMDWERLSWHKDPNNLEWREDISPIELDYYVNFSWFGLDWTDDAAKRITEKTGVNLNLTKPVSDDGQKLNMMIAGDTLPDIITLDRNDPALQTMIDSGKLYSFDELIKEYAPKMKDVLAPEILNNYKSADGKTYRLTTWVQHEAWQKVATEYNQLIGTNQPVWSIRKDYYEEIGSPKIDTKKDFMSALEKMHKNHPEKIAFYPANNALSSANFLTSAAMGNYGVQFGLSMNMSEIDGNIIWSVRSDEFKSSVEFLNEAYKKGLLTKDPFIDTNDIAISKIERGDVIAYTGVIADAEKIPADNPDTQYIPIAPFDTYHQIRTGAGWLATVIPKTCKEPERAIKFLEYMASVEGHKDVSWGLQGSTYSGDVIEGAHWNLVDGKPLHLDDYLVDKNADWAGTAAKNGLGEYWLACNELLWNLPWWNNSDEKMVKFNEVYAPLVEYIPKLDILAPTPSSEEGIISQKVHSLLQNSIITIVFSDDWESEYKDFITEAENLGLKSLEAYYDNLYKEKLSLSESQ
ncbi:MAG: extracellular solute-binding protein [Lachnospirales bacterium]